MKGICRKHFLLSALGLVEVPDGPVLEDFTEDAPVSSEQPVVLACPINIRTDDTVGGTEAENLCAAFKNEIMSMRPWYDMAVNKRSRTTVGLSKLDLVAMGDFICSFIEGNVPDNPRQDISLADELRFSLEDLKAYYFEAVTAQPGMEVSSAKPLLGWFWKDTAAGKALLAVADSCINTEDETLQRIGRGLVASSDTVISRN